MKKMLLIPMFLLSHAIATYATCANDYEWCMSWAWAYYNYDISDCNFWNYSSCQKEAEATWYDAIDDCERDYIRCRNNEM